MFNKKMMIDKMTEMLDFMNVEAVMDQAQVKYFSHWVEMIHKVYPDMEEYTIDMHLNKMTINTSEYHEDLAKKFGELILKAIEIYQEYYVTKYNKEISPKESLEIVCHQLSFEYN